MSSSSGDWIKLPIIMLIIGIPAFYHGLTSYLLMQKIRNTPTSKVRSAAVGLVELFGKAKCKDDMPSPISKEKCVFWRLNAQYYQPGKHGGWRNIYNKDSSMQFYLEDETGEMLIDPKNGNIEIPQDFSTKGRLKSSSILFGLDSNKQIDQKVLDYMVEDPDFAKPLNGHKDYDLMITESYIAEGDPLYVLGSAMPISGASSAISNENLFVGKNKTTDNMLYIRDTEEKKILDQFRISVPLGIGGGFLLIMGALIILLLGFKIY
jgi:hypothetical protein